VLAVGVLLDRHLVFDPGERNIGLRAAKLLQCGLGDVVLPGQASGGSEHAVGADEITALPNSIVGKSHCLVVVPTEELRVGSDAAVHRRKRIARAQPQRATRSDIAFFPPPTIG
jgi:hypothetical protein